MKFLCVLAHPEPASFTSSLARHGMNALEDEGHVVDVADLYAMGFDPVSDRRNFIMAANPGRFDQQAEEKLASVCRGFASDLQKEMDRLDSCDVLVLQFPIWWLGMPAIMKGWIDRVFAIGRTYGGGRWFDRGMMRGKKAMLAVTIGGTEEAYSRDGIYGSALDVLRPINHGILAFCGFEVVEPFIAFAPARKTEAERQEICCLCRSAAQHQCGTRAADVEVGRLRTFRAEAPRCLARTSCLLAIAHMSERHWRSAPRT